MAKDYYDILGVSKKATKAEIKKAYRKLASKYHPDRGKGNEEKMKEVNVAYETLYDDKKRAEYDALGSEYGKRTFNHGYENWDFSEFQKGRDFRGSSFDFERIFGDIFGHTFENRRVSPSAEIDITFQESVFGVSKTVIFEHPVKCEKCGGKGGSDGTKMTCPDCKGSGEGKSRDKMTIILPAGISDGQVVRAGNANENFLLLVRVKPHKTIRREGDNLVSDTNIKLTDAMLGGKCTITTLDGDVQFSIPKCASDGDVIRIGGRGCPNGRGKRGDFLAIIRISLPKTLSENAKKLFEELRKEGV